MRGRAGHESKEAEESRPRNAQAVTILAVALMLAAALALGGCGMGTTELPATTQPGGPGFLSITTPELADGIQGLSYSATINTAGGSARLASCTVISGSLPPGFGPPQTQGSQCVLSTSDPAAVAAGRYTFTLQAGDTSTPERTDNHAYSLTIRPAFTINPPVIPDAVTGRSYTRTFAITTNLVNHSAGQSVIGSSEAGNGPATACSLAGLPAPFTQVSCAIDSTGVSAAVTMNAADATLAPGSYPFSISITDSPIPQATGAGIAVPAETVTLPLNLVVRQEFGITQASLADAVQGRTYGVSPLAQPATTSVVAVAPASSSGQSAELGNGPLTRCTVTASPADPALAAAVDPANRSRCLLTNASPLAAAGSYSVAVSATDSPILDPLSGQVVVPANTETRQFTWVVNPPISYSLNFDSAAGQPGQVPDAVEGRTYGATPKTPVIVTATGGLSTTDGLSITETGTLPTGVACATASPSNPQPPGATATLTCSSDQPVGTPAGATNFAVTVSDAGNGATPGGSISQDTNGHASHLLNVDPPLALTVSISDPLPPAVSGRSYAVAPSAPLVYTASGGLAGYRFTTPADSATPAAAFPQGFTCAAATATFTCSAASITAAGSTTAFGPVPVTLDDTANQTTPDGATSSPVTTAVASRSLLVNPPLSIIASGSAALSPLPSGVVGRTYGVGSGFTPLIYTAEGGDPPYTFTAIAQVSSPASSGLPAPAACTVGNAPGQATAGDQLTCASASGLSAAAGTYPFTITVQDSGSGGVAAASTSLSQSVTVNPALSLTPQLTSVPLAVTGRTYGDPNVTCSGGPCQPIVYNISGGLGGYSESGTNSAAPVLSGFPGSFTCPFSSTGSLSGTYSCYTASAVAGSNPSVLSITATDTANAATPSTAVTNDALSLQVNSALTLAPAAGESPATAVFNRSYGATSGCSGGACKPIVYDVANGTGVYPASATLTTSAGPFTCALSGTTYNCSSAGITLNPTTPTTAPLSASVTDVANASTPAGTASDSSLNLTVNPPLSVSGPSGTLAIAVSNRTYGSGSTCGASDNSPCATIGYTVTNGLGGYTTSPTLNGYPSTFQCPFTSTGTLSGSYACASPSGVSAVATPASDTVSLTVTDTANASTPSASATSGTATLPVNPVLAFTPPSTVNPAVTNRAYGTGSGCSGGACQPLAYAIANGTSSFPSSATLTTTAGSFSCSLSGSTYNCSSAAITGTTTPAPLSISVSDIANASTPSGSASDNSRSLAIDAPLSLTLTSGAPAPSVVGRAYGTGSGCSGGACVPITYSISGGLGGYTNLVTPTGSPTAITGLGCTLSSNTYSCSAATLGPTSLASQAVDTLSATVTDTANASTPSSSVTNTSASLTLNPQMTIAPATGQGAPANAVFNQPYGSGSSCSGGTCAPIKYTVTGGLGNYAASATLTETPTALTGFSCAISGATYSCSASLVGPSSSSQAVDTLSITTSETGDASTPGATTPANTSLSLTANPALAMSISPSPLSSSPAVTNRSYGSGSFCGSGGSTVCAPLEFTATGGTVESSGSNYVYTVSPNTALSSAGFNSCTAGGTNGANYTCTSTSISATSAIDLSKVSVDDVANASVPASPSFSISTSLPVNAPLSIPATPVPNNALLGYQYSSFFTLPVANGLSTSGISSWSVYAPATPTSPCPANDPTRLNGFALDTITGVISGTPTTAGTSTFDSCATDVANGSTPAGTGASAHPPDYSFTVLSPYAYAIDPGASAIDVVNTGAGGSSTPAATTSVSVGSATLTSPLGVAITQDGLEAVAIVSTNKLEIIDTSTNAAVSGSPFALAPPASSPSAACTTAKGIAIFGTTAYIACDNGGASDDEIFEVPITNPATSPITATAAVDLGNKSLAPVAIAVSSDGSTLAVAEATTAPALQIIQTSNGTLSPLVSLTTGVTPVAVTTAANGSNTYAYIAETVSGSPGQVDVVSMNSSFAGSLLTPVTFAAVSSTNPEPTCIAATPDAARVWVGLGQTDQVAVFANSSSPGSPAAFSFPGLAGGAAGTLAPSGVAIPPLNPPLGSNAYRVFITTSGGSSGNDVYYFNDKAGAPSAGSASILTLSNTSSTPEGIAAMPVPTLP